MEEKTKSKKDSLMTTYLNSVPQMPEAGDVVEGPVISIDKNAVFIDLAPFGTGMIFGREFLNSRDVIKKLNIGDSVAGKVVDREGRDGYIEVSLKEARQAIIWSEAEEAIKNKTLLELPVVDANKGGLIMSWQGIQGFLPASQLSTENYPRVEDGDKEKIFEELKKFIGQKLSVSVITASPKEGKMIFSEKGGEDLERKEVVEKYKVGDELDGVVTGMVDFGIFVKVNDSVEGLVHISEIDWSLVEDPKALYKVGEKVKVKVIEVKDGKISLSIKALKDNPWKNAAEKYKKGDSVEGVIIKYNKHGALASIEEGVAGLIHISEFGNEEKLREALELGKSYKFNITLFDVKDQKMALSFKDANEAKE